MKPVQTGNEDGSAASIARALIATAAFGALATLAADGSPFATLVALAQAEDGAPMLLMSRRAIHARNLARDSRASLLIAAAAGGGNPLALARLSLTGTVVPIEKDAAARARFVARHPDAEGYVGLADFGLHRLAITAAHLVAGFGRVADLAPAELLDTSHS
jgi:putative heme iron utilization protein